MWSSGATNRGPVDRDEIVPGRPAEAANPIPPRFHVLGVRVDAMQIPDVIARVERWIDSGERGRFIAFTGMHGIMEARQDPRFREVLAAADLVVADGMPLVWLGRLRGFPMKRRVYGPDFLLAFCCVSADAGYRHFFYGGAPGVPEELARRLRRRFPALRVAGTLSPPFRALTPAERDRIRREINEARPDVVWVGLGTPKQEAWMFENRDGLDVPVLLGVGAAFDFHTGRVRQAPVWVREHGLEWSWRLLSEPRRLWRRYLVQGSRFVFSVGLDLLRIRSFE